MVASGFAALGYQIVWTQRSALWLGHESAAVLAVVAAFFGGLALGSLALGARIERSARPAHWYAACEAAIALWSLVLAFVMAPASEWLLGLTGARPSALRQWTLAFGGTFVLLLPATAAMGATLPAMERVMARLRQHGASIAMLYAGNTFGAVIGVLAAAFWLVPAWGLTRTAALCAVLNLLCAVAVLRLPRGGAEAADDESVAPAAPSAALPWQLAATGALGIAYEVLVVRVLGEVAENTVYTFAMLLAVYLVGSALGAAAYQRWGSGSNRPQLVRDRLLALLAACCVAGTASLWAAPWLQATTAGLLGAGMGSALAAEAVLAVAAFLPPTLVMGALFSHLSTQARAAGIAFGRSLGINTLGAAVAPPVFGVLLLPALGPKLALLLVAAGYLVLLSPRAWRGPLALPALATAAFGVVLALWAAPLAFVELPEGGRIVSYRDGAMAAVSVVEDAEGVSRLRINNRAQEGSSATVLADARQALLPLLLHPAPKHALFLGLGTGVTASSAAQEPGLDVDAVELLPEVIEASSHFTPAISGGQPNPRLHLLAGDARRYVRAAATRYDLIVSDNFHPARSGSAALYTVEHFRAVRARLADGGLFCQWLPLHQLDLPTLRSIVASFLAANPDALALLATNSLDTPVLGLVAHAGGGRFDPQAVRERLAHSTLPQAPAEFGLADEFALLGSFVAGPQALARFAVGAPLNTDDHPVVAYLAPRITYVPDSRPRDRLAALLQELHVAPGEVLPAAADAAWSARLAAYWRARDRFIVAGRDVRPVSDVRLMLAQVQAPLLSVLRTSPDFRPAYEPLLRMAAALSRSDAAAARELLAELARVQPARAEAAELLSSLDAPDGLVPAAQLRR
ncbi:MAG: spermidine synthase [Aquabacterium sp.]|nr:MAG: spermidine synthase [Aquabacterium sp.]